MALRVQWMGRYNKRKQLSGLSGPSAEDLGRAPKRPATHSIFSLATPQGAREPPPPPPPLQGPVTSLLTVKAGCQIGAQ